MESFDKLKSKLSALDLDPDQKNELEQILAAFDNSLNRQAFALNRLTTDKIITERYLSTTISELEESNEQLKIYKQKEIEEKERQLNFKETQIRQIIGSLPTSIAFIDKEFNYRITNHLYKKWFGRNTKDMLGFNVKDLVGDEIFNDYSKPNLEMAFSGISHVKDIVLPNYEGKMLYLRLTYVPATDVDGRNMGAYVFGEDISDLKSIQAALQNKNAELQQYIESYLQLENFSHLASHDLSAPLKNILSFSTLLEQKAKTKLDEDELVYLNFIQKGARNMHDTIKGLLDFSLVSNTEPKFVEFNISDMIDNLLVDIDSTIQETSAKVSVDYVPSKIIADRVLIRQLLQNLILNGIKFRKSDKTPEIKIYSKEDIDWYWFFVKDNGIGIEEKYLENIFVVFKRLHTKEEYPGTGMGLAISKKIINLHGGDIKARSGLGQGSTFYFSIPKNLKPSDLN